MSSIFPNNFFFILVLLKYYNIYFIALLNLQIKKAREFLSSRASETSLITEAPAELLRSRQTPRRWDAVVHPSIDRCNEGSPALRR